MPKISVIVPVYNVEKYLIRCIESILSQSLTDFELILINDGSINNECKICDQYAKIDKRITVINKINAGVSAARNVGINISQGDYLYFCDSDDYLDKFCLEKLFQVITEENSDCVVMNYYLNSINNTISHCLQTTYLGNNDLRLQFIIDYVIKGDSGRALWMKLIKASIVRDFSLRICETCDDYAEDMGFYLVFLLYCKKISVTNYAGYYYCQHEQSMMYKTQSEIKMNSLNEVSRYFSLQAQKLGITNKNSKLIIKMHFWLLFPQILRFISSDRLREVPVECNKIVNKCWYNRKMLRVIINRKYVFEGLSKRIIHEYCNICFYTIHKRYHLYCFFNGLYYKINKG